MRAGTLLRCGGLAAMAGGVLWVAMLIETAVRPAHGHRGPIYPLLFAALILIAGGVLGVYARQRGRAGRLGVVAGALAGVGLGLTMLGRLAVDLLGAPPALFAGGLLLFIAGLLLFAVSTIRAGVLPRGVAWLLAVGMGLFVPFNFGDARVWLAAPFGMAWVWLGYALWADPGPAARGRAAGTPPDAPSVVGEQ